MASLTTIILARKFLIASLEMFDWRGKFESLFRRVPSLTRVHGCSVRLGSHRPFCIEDAEATGQYDRCGLFTSERHLFVTPLQRPLTDITLIPHWPACSCGWWKDTDTFLIHIMIQQQLMGTQNSHIFLIHMIIMNNLASCLPSVKQEMGPLSFCFDALCW